MKMISLIVFALLAVAFLAGCAMHALPPENGPDTQQVFDKNGDPNFGSRKE